MNQATNASTRERKRRDDEYDAEERNEPALRLGRVELELDGVRVGPAGEARPRIRRQ